MNKNPWKYIEKPGEDLSARLADPAHPLEFYWAKDVYGRYLFLLHSTQNLFAPEHIPELNGIEIRLGHLMSEKRDQLALILQDEENRDIFHSLCVDLMDATRQTKDERSATRIILNRLQRWQQFLKKAGLKIDERKLRGLFGELWFLREKMMRIYDPSEAVRFWFGAEGDRHDFGIGRIHVEVKTRAATSRNIITISSAEQLECQKGSLYLWVLTLAKAASDGTDTYSVPELVESIRRRILEYPDVTEYFDSQLMEYGYFDLEEYRSICFLPMGEHAYTVTDEFPRMTSSVVPQGIENLRYDLNLNICNRWMIPEDRFLQILKGMPI